MAYAIPSLHRYSPEPSHYKEVPTGRRYLFGLLEERVIVADEYKCWCGRDEKDFVHTDKENK
jgi:hypothetical protein